MDVIALLRDGGEWTSHGLLLVTVVGVLRGWWVPRWYYDALEAERDEWRSLAKAGQAIVRHVAP